MFNNFFFKILQIIVGGCKMYLHTNFGENPSSSYLAIRIPPYAQASSAAAASAAASYNKSIRTHPLQGVRISNKIYTHDYPVFMFSHIDFLTWTITAT